MEKHPLHLKDSELQTSPEVQEAVVRQEHQTGEKIPNDPKERIEAYMDRLENIFLNPNKHTRERNLEMFRDKIYDELIIKKENFPESYFDLQKRVARERGQAVEVIPENVREQMMDVAINDQKTSLDSWMDYLTSNDAVYPAWFKYFVWKNIIKLSQFDKERGEFKKRTNSTVAPFPDIYREPLAQIADVYEKVKADNKNLKEPEIKELFSKKFPDIYADLIQKSLASSMESSEITRGEWVKYKQGSNEDATKLFTSLENKGTGWCTAGSSTAKAQIESGDFYVYYTNDIEGAPTKPRLAIRMDGEDKIGEIRGILPHQNIEPIMQETLDKKLADFGNEADAYKKKSADMKKLTLLEQKYEQEKPFTKDDLVFIYEINNKIQGFGYQKDPRIEELRKGRNIEEDTLVILDCTKDQIAHVPSEIDKNTKAYIGQLEPGIFQKLPENMEHVYTSFPENKIKRENIEVGGKTKKQLISEMKSANISISDYAKSMIDNSDFITSKKSEEMTLVRLTVADLGFKTRATTDKIYERAEALGLELCPSEVGPNYRLQYKSQPLSEWLYIGMKQITDSHGYPRVFKLERRDGGFWLNHSWATPDSEWGPDGKFVFRLRKIES